ncbi:MAG: hypothetical protein FH749_08635 [Firmicutes bacterium]|nr:hypothetical protein [Bacillota bacterium]
MDFAFISCPVTLSQLRLSRPGLRLIPGGLLSGLNRFLPIKEKAMLDVAGAPGVILEYPGLPEYLVDLSPSAIEKKAVQIGKILAANNIKILGLEDSLQPLAPVICAEHPVRIPTGLTITLAALLAVFSNFLSENTNSRAVIISPLSPPGAVIARLLAPRLRSLVLVSNLRPGLKRLAQKIIQETGTASVLSHWHPGLLPETDIIIDLAGLDLSELKSPALIWQPYGGRPPQSARTLGLPLLDFPGVPAVHGDLPAGILRPNLTEAILVATGERRLWARNFNELTAANVITASKQSRVCKLRVTASCLDGYIHWFPAPIEI